MNKNERVMIGKLDERTKFIHESIDDIKKLLEKMEKSIDSQSKIVSVVKANLDNHLRHHELTRTWIQWMPSAIAVMISAIAIAKVFIFP